MAISNAIDWFFRNVEEGIILEDDCIPSSSFFKFAEKMLNKYRKNNQIFHISGNNFHPHKNDRYNYYFSKYPHIWGWATWKRAWKKYKVSIDDWPKNKKDKLFDKQYLNYAEKIYWQGIFDLVHQNQIDTWDYQWLYCCWLNKGLSITPKYNLVKNIGFGESATHTKKDNSTLSNFPTQTIQSFSKHPKRIIINKQYDLETSLISYGITWTRVFPRMLYFQIKKIIKNI